MSNWMIVSQEAKVNKETVSVDCKEISWRPSSPKEQAAGGGEFKRLGTPTFRVTFKHIKGTGIYKVVAQYVKMKRGGKLVKLAGIQQFEWRVNMHYPDKVVRKQLMTRNRVTSVSIDCPSGETKIEKSSTGTSPYDSFFSRVFPGVLRCEAMRFLIEGLLSEAISEREAAKEAA
jgi:hypothetical protein